MLGDLKSAAIAAVCAAVVPQQPPTRRAPTDNPLRRQPRELDGIDLFGKEPPLGIGGRPEVPVGSQGKTGGRRGQASQVVSELSRRHAIDRERVGHERPQIRDRTPDRIAGKKAPLPVRDHRGNHGKPSRFRGADRGDELPHRVLRLDQDAVDSGGKKQPCLFSMLGRELRVGRHELGAVAVFEWRERAENEDATR